MTSSSGTPRLPIATLLGPHCTTSRLAAAAAVAGLAVTAGHAQPPLFQSGVSIVEVYASVTDRAGTPITGLGRERFTVREDGRPQPITAFAAADVPLSLALAIDRSWSMAGAPLAAARRGGRALVSALRPADRVMLIAVSGRVETAAPLSTDHRAVEMALDRLDPWSTTALHDAIIEAVDLVQAGAGRRALVIVSDGSDRYSRATETDVVQRVRARDVLIYAISTGQREPPLFAELAAVTGGRSFHARDAAALERTMRLVVDDLHHQYLLGYAPPESGAGPGTWRAIDVAVDVPDARVRARRGYVAR